MCFATRCELARVRFLVKVYNLARARESGCLVTVAEANVALLIDWMRKQFGFPR